MGLKYETAQYEASYGAISQLPSPETPEVAFVGRSNVGKSSLLNKLIGRKQLARVSSVPGKTCSWSAKSCYKDTRIRFSTGRRETSKSNVVSVIGFL